MKMHPREERVREAERDMLDFLSAIQEKHGLTEAEMLRVVSSVSAEWIGWAAKYAIRMERHGDKDTPGGLEPDQHKSDGT